MGDTTVSGFGALGLSATSLAAVELAGYTMPTPVQAGLIPRALAGVDVLGQARTGTGKTAAFVLPILDRMKEIVRELREFSHKRSEVLGEFPVRDSVDVAVRMLGKEIDDHEVAVDLRIDGTMLVRGVKNQLAQVFINLVHNAVQAMGAVDTGRKNRIIVDAHEAGDQVVVTVVDNGPGIPDRIREEIFDPFFTTKEAGEGTGLGLSICFRIVAAHRGTIQVFSDGATYTEFRVTLPSPTFPMEADPTATPDDESQASAGDRSPHHTRTQPLSRTSETSPGSHAPVCHEKAIS